MNQFVLSHTTASELRLFPHIIEIGVIKNSAIRLNGFPCIIDRCLKLYYIQEGKFEWSVNERLHTLYPGDAALVLPGDEFGNPNKVLEIGSFAWIHIQVSRNEKNEIVTGAWSSLSEAECHAISKVLQTDHSPILQKFTEAGTILKSIQTELFTQEIGCQARVNHLIDEIFIQLSRQFTRM